MKIKTVFFCLLLKEFFFVTKALIMELILQTERFSVYFVFVASLLNRMRMRMRKNKSESSLKLVKSFIAELQRMNHLEWVLIEL